MTPPKIISIDLNADLGEHPGSDLDEQIMPFISSCNIACGGHIGDEQSVRQTIRLAKKYDVAIGAHPSYPDKENFGRKIIEISKADLKQNLSAQIGLVQQICKEETVFLHHIKPHGALYNHAACDKNISQLILEVLKELVPDVFWMGLANSDTESTAKKNNHPFISEGFADRKYEPNGKLRSRSEKGAVLHGDEVLVQVEELVMNHRVEANGWLPIEVQSICLHSDTEGAVTLAKEIRQHLESKGIQIAAI